MEEHFVGYLLGALDPATHARVEAYLKAHPEARDRLALLEEALAPLAEDADDPAPPPGLALATLARIAEHRERLPDAPATPRRHVGATPRPWLRRADWAVAACLLVLAGGLGLLLLARAWQVQARAACGNNLRQFWVALAAYSDRGEGDFPRVEPAGPRSVAGIFVPVLTDAGLALDVSVGCPARGRREPPRCSVAELERLYEQAPEEYRGLARELAGHYAYCLGYQEGTRLRGLRRDTADCLPILADGAEGPGNSLNHGGSGQNVLYVGGHVRWAAQPTVGEEGDNIYVNRHNRVGAGVCRPDSVLGASDARPYLSE
jgi:anti-sigma factor RsiW